MSTVKFYGASDDLFEIEGAMSEELSFYDNLISGTLHSPDGGVLAVVASFAPEGAPATWVIAPMLVEGHSMPDWPLRYEPESEYSMALLVDVPPGTVFIVDDRVVCRVPHE